MLFNCCGHSLVGNGVWSTWYHRMPFVKTYHYEKMWLLMYLYRWQVIKAQVIQTSDNTRCMFIDVSSLLVPPLCCFSLSIVLQTTRKGKSRNGFEKTLWFGINFWKDLHGHQGLSLPSLSVFSLSSCRRAVTVLPVLFDTQRSDVLEEPHCFPVCTWERHCGTESWAQLS